VSEFQTADQLTVYAHSSMVTGDASCMTAPQQQKQVRRVFTDLGRVKLLSAAHKCFVVT